MDEYKEYVYRRHPLIYFDIDAGDVSKQKALRKKLQCKSFKWFMETIAFDIIPTYPLEEPSFAYGGIRNLGLDLCIDTMSKSGSTPLGVFGCAQNITFPHRAQSFSLTLDYRLRVRFEKLCWSKTALNTVWLMKCSDQPNNDYQIWKYDLVNNFYDNNLNVHINFIG